MTSVMSSDVTSRAAEIMEGGGSGSGRLGALGMRRPERARKRDGFIVRKKEFPWMPPANVEGEVAAHALSAVCQRRTEAFVGWALTVPRGGSSLWGNPAHMLAMEFIVVGRRRVAVVNTGT